MTVHTPIESRTRGIPRWALAVTGVMLLAGAVFFATNLGGSNPPIAGHIYWMFFANAGKLVKPGDHVSVAIGEFRTDNLVVR